ncbi:MAG TPA: hypothetical protein VMF91_20835 [Bryobacteraceae bacterium]|nr:hypothetical protein [Bryobacteraceae bacterium]
MSDDDVLSKIAYLDEDLSENDNAASTETSELQRLVRTAIQIEIARRTHWAGFPNEALASRVACLEDKFQQLASEMAIRKERPSVQYVKMPPEESLSRPVSRELQKASAARRLPRTIVAFYVAGLGCSLAFAILLALSSMGVRLIHPFLSLIGLVGGLGWLTTAWTDLLLWKREIIPLCGSRPRKKNNVAA